MPMTPQTWNLSTLAVEFQMDRRTAARRLAGVPPAGEVRGAPVWRMADAAPALLGIADGDGLDLSAERARLAKAQADAQEMKNAVARAELVPASQVVRACAAVIGACRARLLAIPAKAAPLVVGLEAPHEVRDTLAALVREACQELSQRRLGDELGLRATAEDADTPAPRS